MPLAFYHGDVITWTFPTRPLTAAEPNACYSILRILIRTGESPRWSEWPEIGSAGIVLVEPDYGTLRIEVEADGLVTDKILGRRRDHFA